MDVAQQDVRWRERWYNRDKEYTTCAAGLRELTETTSPDTARQALGVAEKNAAALAKLVEIMQDKGLLTVREVQTVLNLYGYVTSADAE